VIFFAVNVYENASYMREAKKQMEALQTASQDAGAGYFYSAEEESGWYRYFIVTIPATMGLFVWMRRLRG